MSHPRGNDPSSFVLRRLVPLALIVTLATAWLRWWASDRGHLSQTAGVILMTALAVILFTALALWSARKLRAVTSAQRAADRDALYRLVARNNPSGGVFLFDRNLRYVLAEGENFEDVGLSGERLEGRTIWEALDPEAASAVEPSYRAALAGETSSYSMAFRDHTYQVTVAPTYDDDGEVVGGLVQTRDITRESQLEEQLRQSQKLEALGQLAGGVAHDFNNLLTVISGYADLSLRDAPPDTRLHGQVVQIVRAAERAAGLTHQLLAFSRQQVLQPQLLDVNAVVAGVAPMLQRLIEARIDLVFYLAPGLPDVLVDKGKLEQVLINLVLNARDAIDGAGTITIETTETTLDSEYVLRHTDAQVGRHVVLSVSDTGAGIDDEIVGKIFDPFFTTKPPGSGTGLGLSTVHGIVKQSGGNIWLYSEPGRGAAFKIYFPAAAEPAELPEKDAALTYGAPAPAEGLTVLVVEDEEALRKLTLRILEQAGYRVELAASAAEGAALLRGLEVDVILSDLVMPGAGGQTIAGIADARGSCPPIVYMSGYTEATVTRDGPLGAGSRFLEKPFTPAALLSAIAEILRPS
jgi:PAS domain S-box-containing protein